MNLNDLARWESKFADTAYTGMPARKVIAEIVRSYEYTLLSLEDKVVLLTLMMGWVVR